MPRQDHEPITEPEKTAFLEGLATGKSIVEAAGRSESVRRKLYRARTNEDGTLTDFGTAWNETVKLHRRDYLVHVAQTRAIDGWDEPVWHKGEQVGTIRKYDHRLLELLIKQADPSFRERHQVDVGSGDGQPLQVEVKHSVDDLARVASLLAGAGVLPAGSAADATAD